MAESSIDELKRRVAELQDQRDALLDMKTDVEQLLIQEGLPEYEVQGQYLDEAIRKLLKIKLTNLG